MTRPIPLGILAFAMQVETAYFVKELTPLIANCVALRKEVSDLVKRYDILAERMERTTNRAIDLLDQARPLINDVYNLCGDSTCDGTCMVCCDGEYLGEDDYEEKYCRRKRR